MNIWQNRTVNANGLILNGPYNDDENKVFMLVKSLQVINELETLNLSSINTFSAIKGTISGATSGYVINVNDGTLTVTDNSTIKMANNIALIVKNGATLKLEGNSQITAGSITVESGGTLDISESKEYTLDKLPGTVTFAGSGSILKVKEYIYSVNNIDIDVQNGQFLTINSNGINKAETSEGLIPSTKSINGSNVTIQATTSNVTDPRSITVQKGGTLVLDGVTKSSNCATFNSGAKLGLKNSASFQVTTTNSPLNLGGVEVTGQGNKLTGNGRLNMVEGGKININDGADLTAENLMITNTNHQ